METFNSKNPSDFLIARLFVVTIREFLNRTSLHGFKYLVKEGLSIFEKLFWYIIQICALICAAFIFLYAIDGFVTKPTVTSFESVNHPIHEIDFPAVAVCSVNKISKKAAMEYAIELSKRTNNRTVEWLFKNIQYLGHVFQFDIDSIEKYSVFQDLLDVIDVNNETLYDTQNKFEFKISPKCEDFLVRCRWFSKHTDCMKLFQYRKTRDGYCCLFNYVRQFNTLSSERSAPEPVKLERVGSRYGLSLVLNTTISDYYFSTGDHVGFYVNIFTSSDFLDIMNGGATQMIVDTNRRAYFKLIPTTVRSTSDIEQYTPVQRGCLFKHELPDQYAGHYSFVDCLLKCKLRRIIGICHCMPFFLPNNFPDDTKTTIKCTLAHNECLHKWKLKIDSFIIPNMKFDQTLAEDSFECLECLPLCSKTKFRVFSSHFKLNQYGLGQTQSSLVENLSTFDDISIVHIYYGIPETKLFTADVVMTWQEIISHFGGLLGLCFGFSLINIVEIFYFSTVKLYLNYLKLVKSKKNNQRDTSHRRFLKNENRTIREMYVNDYKVDFLRPFRRI